MDIAIRYEETVAYHREIKLLHAYDTHEIVREERLEQIHAYRDKVEPEVPSYLIIFDRRSESKKLPWEQHIQWHVENGITVLGS